MERVTNTIGQTTVILVGMVLLMVYKILVQKMLREINTIKML